MAACPSEGERDTGVRGICRLPEVLSRRFPVRYRLTAERRKSPLYLILPSLYKTCLRTLGSYFLTSIFSGWRRLFLVVV